MDMQLLRLAVNEIGGEISKIDSETIQMREENARMRQEIARNEYQIERLARTKVLLEAAAIGLKPVVEREPADRAEQIAELAHQYWVERGYAHGGHDEDWFRAAQEIQIKEMSSEVYDLGSSPN